MGSPRGTRSGKRKETKSFGDVLHAYCNNRAKSRRNNANYCLYICRPAAAAVPSAADICRYRFCAVHVHHNGKFDKASGGIIG